MENGKEEQPLANECGFHGWIEKMIWNWIVCFQHDMGIKLLVCNLFSLTQLVLKFMNFIILKTKCFIKFDRAILWSRHSQGRTRVMRTLVNRSTSRMKCVMGQTEQSTNWYHNQGPGYSWAGQSASLRSRRLWVWISAPEKTESSANNNHINSILTNATKTSIGCDLAHFTQFQSNISQNAC